MDRYQRVEKPRQETPINENEIRVTTQGQDAQLHYIRHHSPPGRGHGRGRGRGRGGGWTQDSRSDGPVQAAT